MKDKDLEKSLNEFHQTDLTFTKEDREKVFRKIEEENTRKKTNIFQAIRYRAAPIIAMAVLLSLSVILAYSFISSTNNQNADQADKQTALEQNEDTTLLFLVTNEEHRTDFHLLISYNENKGSINLLYLPPDIYVTAENSGTATEDKDKLSHVYAYGEGAQSVQESVSQILGMPIDYYAAVKLDDFEYMLKSLEGTEYRSNGKISWTSPEGVQIELEKGLNLIEGKKAVDLLTADVPWDKDEDGWDEQDKMELSEAVLKNLLKQLRTNSIHALFGSAETNADLEKVLGELAATKLNTMETISLTEELKVEWIGDIYYLQFKKDAVMRIKKEITTFE
ncbi:LCP family protein [Bacillus sp. SCS-153A]|uniref:LCP family protein n=1 Tax=Rossellomorea sedimentorum TaxID=3115294 RepID=UPI003906AE3A